MDTIFRKDNIHWFKPRKFKDKFLDFLEDIDIWFWRTFINPIIARKDRLVYAWERARYGFDRRISWGPESTIEFYVKLLSDLINYSHGRPWRLDEIIGSERFKKVSDKWNEILGTNFSTDIQFADYFEQSKDEKSNLKHESKSNEYFNDVFNAWIDYLKEVRQYFLDAGDLTCSMKNEYENDFVFNPTWIEQEDGSFLMEDGNLTEEQERKNKLYRDKHIEIEKFKENSLKKGLSEIAKNPYAFCD